jgi:type I restriction enzyme M protein
LFRGSLCPIKLEHLDDCAEWWGGAERKGRKNTDRAWKATAEDIKARGYNLDIKNPHTEKQDHGDPEQLLAELNQSEAEVAELRTELKKIFAEALLR